MRFVTEKQALVLDGVLEGLTDREIGEMLGISELTTQQHVHNARCRIGKQLNRKQLAAWWKTHRDDSVR